MDSATSMRPFRTESSSPCSVVSPTTMSKLGNRSSNNLVTDLSPSLCMTKASTARAASSLHWALLGSLMHTASLLLISGKNLFCCSPRTPGNCTKMYRAANRWFRASEETQVKRNCSSSCQGYGPSSSCRAGRKQSSSLILYMMAEFRGGGLVYKNFAKSRFRTGDLRDENQSS